MTIIGSSVSPSEIIKVTLPNGQVLNVFVLYDPGSQISLVSAECSPMFMFKTKTRDPICLTTVAGESTQVRQIASFNLFDYYIEAIVLKHLQLSSRNLSGFPPLVGTIQPVSGLYSLKLLSYLVPN